LAQLVRSGIVVDAAEGLVYVSGQWVGGGDDVVSGLDLDGAVGAGSADESSQITRFLTSYPEIP
jgi:hypothetical protein